MMEEADARNIIALEAAGIQPHGLLFVLHGTDFLITQASANCSRLIGRRPAELLGKTLPELVDPRSRSVVEAALRESSDRDPESFRATMLTGDGREGVAFEGIIHRLSGGCAVVELERDPVLPDGSSPSPGPDSSLRFVRRSLAAVSGHVLPVDAARALAREVRGFIGFDRVMVQRIGEDGSGEIVADEHGVGMASLLGLRIQAAGMASDSREEFLAGRPRYYFDAAASPVPLIPSACPHAGALPDLSRAVLRSLPVAQVRHLAALEVTSGLTLPLVVSDRLWGLVVCQHRRRKYLTHEQRLAASLGVRVFSDQMALRERAAELQDMAVARAAASSVVADITSDAGFLEDLGKSLEGFLRILEADGVALLSVEAIHSVGSVPDRAMLSSFHDELKEMASRETRITDGAADLFSSLAGCLPRAAGVAAIPLGRGEWLVGFRDEKVSLLPCARDLSVPGNVGREAEIRGRSAPWPSTMTALATEIRSALLDLSRYHAARSERTSRNLRHLAGAVAHEVKNKLQPGVLALAMLRADQGYPLRGEFSQLAELGERALHDLAKFTTVMLDYSGESFMESLDVALIDEAVKQATEPRYS
ncbi:GAF domain-containing protein [Luteolibacter flavescens]|uniref:GAF domain-containing protein n=1 Tax=Luteolibacter flavescens TaxID=1859460 RepID=A0ABT3FJ12_9BACT|nr:GAF domain-containing protein [Luteolibacter flavescens]MCW1883560.1 GAF domain-containing protein [Luteolibacter flavescens]